MPIGWLRLIYRQRRMARRPIPNTPPRCNPLHGRSGYRSTMSLHCGLRRDETARGRSSCLAQSAIQLPNTGWPGARSIGGRGLARPVAPGGASLLAVLVSIRSSVVKNAASTAITTATAKSRTAVRWLFRSLLMRDLHYFTETQRIFDGSSGATKRRTKGRRRASPTASSSCCG